MDIFKNASTSSKPGTCCYSGCSAQSIPYPRSELNYCDRHAAKLFSDLKLGLPSSEKSIEFLDDLDMRELAGLSNVVLVEYIILTLSAFGGRIPKLVDNPQDLYPYLNNDLVGPPLAIWREQIFLGSRMLRRGKAPNIIDFDHYAKLLPANKPVIETRDCYLPNDVLFLGAPSDSPIMILKKPYKGKMIDNAVFSVGVCGNLEPREGSAVTPIRLYVVALMVAPKWVCQEQGKLMTNFLSFNLVLLPSSPNQNIYEALSDVIYTAGSKGYFGDDLSVIGYAGERALTVSEAANALGVIGISCANILHTRKQFDVTEKTFAFFDEPYLRPKTFFLKELYERLGYTKLILDEGWNG